MRTLYLLSAAIVAVFLASPASAELIIYKGTLKQTASGLGVSRKIVSQYYLIVDHDTANIAQIQSTTVNGSKTYGTDTETNLHFVQMSGAKGKTIQAIAQPPSDCDISAGQTSEGVFVQGTDSSLAVTSGSTTTFPKSLSGGGSQIDYSQGPPIIIASTAMLTFDTTQTQLSNGNGETLDQALTRISSILEAQGFQKQSQKTKSSRYPLRMLEIER
jgi:hypothetical protein